MSKLPPWARTVVSAISVILAIIGLAGIPDDLITWNRWSEMMSESVPWWVFILGSLLLLSGVWGPVLFSRVRKKGKGKHNHVSNEGDNVRDTLNERMASEHPGIEKKIFLGQLFCLFDELDTNQLIQFTFKVYNGSLETIVLDERAGGFIVCEGVELESPPRITIPKKEVGRGDESLITIRQQLPLAVAENLFRALEDGERQTFKFSKLRIEFSAGNDKFRIPLHEGILVNKAIAMTGRALSASVSESIKLGES